jgi:hypothetical protein
MVSSLVRYIEQTVKVHAGFSALRAMASEPSSCRTRFGEFPSEYRGTPPEKSNAPGSSNHSWPARLK